MWEHFTTKPYFHGGDTPLKNIGEIYTPWPSWHIAASTKRFPEPERDEKLQQVFETLDAGVKQFQEHTDEGVRLLGTGELGCHYTEEDAREWLKNADFFESTRGVDLGTMDTVVGVLQGAGVIGSSANLESGDGIVGVRRST